MRKQSEITIDSSVPDQGWFYHHRGRELGPLDLDALRDTLRLLPRADVLIWHPSLPEWVSPDEAGVRNLLSSPPLPLAEPQGLLASLFLLEGRLGRWRYLRLSCLAFAAATTLHRLAPALPRLDLGAGGAETSLVLLIPLFWIGSALTAKRLHDLGLTAAHLFWLMPLTGGAGLVEGEPTRALCALAGAAAGLWLLLKRGTHGANRFGPAPDGNTTHRVGFVAAPSAGRTSAALVVLIGLAVVGALLAYGDRVLDAVRPSPTLCADPGVLARLRDLVLKDPNVIILWAYYGTPANMRISFHSVRTLDEGSPVRGSACVAMMHLAAVDRSKAALGDQDLGDIAYTVQHVDGSSTDYVVVLR